MDDSTAVVPTADGPMDVYEARPDGEARGAVVVVQEAFGVNHHIQDVTRRFAAAGYFAVAPAFFHRAGGGTAPYDDFSQVMPLFAGVTEDGILMDVDATLAHVRDAGFADDNIGVVGFCFGGRVSFLVAARRAIGAGVGFYGGGIVGQGGLPFPPLIGEAATLRTPWLGLFGDLDAGIPVEGVEELRAALRDAKVDTEIVRYPEAEHGFHCDARSSYHKESALDGWQRTLDWLAGHL
jgi:carboxymethylenebutenolidase